jgi:hypothetical protein
MAPTGPGGTPVRNLSVRNILIQTLVFLVGVFLGYAPLIFPTITIQLGWTISSILVSISLIWIGYEISFAQKRIYYISPILFIGIIAALVFIWSGVRPPPPPPTCFSFSEENGQVVMKVKDYMKQLSGRVSPSDRFAPTRNAEGLLWQQSPDFPDALQALPDTQATNTMSDTNGPALLYVIDFKTPGRYYAYFRGVGASDDGDSIHFGLGGVPSNSYVYGFSIPSDPHKLQWIGTNDSRDNVFVDVPSPGIYTFYVWMRENGVTVEKIWLDTGKGKIKDSDTTSTGPQESRCQP